MAEEEKQAMEVRFAAVDTDSISTATRSRLVVEGPTDVVLHVGETALVFLAEMFGAEVLGVTDGEGNVLVAGDDSAEG